MADQRRYASSTEVARLAGVSQSAVSRSFTPGASVAPATREKVLAAARALGYRPNFLPQALQSHRSRLVAVAVGGITNPFYAAVLEAFTAALQEAGQQVVLIQIDSDYALDGVLDRIAGYRVDALVSALAVLSPETAAELSGLRIPVVCLNGHVRGEWVSSIGSDNRRAGARAADHLRDRGGRHFAFLGGPPDSPAARDRQLGFAGRLRTLGLPPPLLLPGDFSRQAGLAAAERVARAGPRPDAVACANDLSALGLLDGLRRQGLEAPRDLRVLGFDNTIPADWEPYSLTSFEQDVPGMIGRSLRLILEEDAAEEARRGVLETLPVRLVARASTALSPGGAPPAAPR